MSMYAMCADFVKDGGGEPHDVGALGLHEHRPSPPISRAACIDAISLAARSPGVEIAASTACCTTGAPVSTFPWMAYATVPIWPEMTLPNWPVWPPAHWPSPVPLNVAVRPRASTMPASPVLG